MNDRPKETDTRPCQCPECGPGPGIDFAAKHRKQEMRFMDDRIRMFLKEGWSVESETEM